MGQEDLPTLLDMGFDKTRAEIAVKKPGGRKCLILAWCSCPIQLTQLAVTGALEWLEKTQDLSMIEIQADEEEDAVGDNAEIKALEEGQTAKSLVCNECGKRFRNQALAQYHASKTYVAHACTFRAPY